MGCQATFVGTRGPQQSTQETRYLHHFLWGTAGRDEVRISELCGSKSLRRMQLDSPALSWLFALTSLGLYTPRRLTVECVEMSP